MKDFNRVAIMAAQDSVSRGFMFEYIQENFPYQGWAPVGYAAMDAFEKTFGDIKAPAGLVRERRDDFITALEQEIATRFGSPMAGHKAFTDLTQKIRDVLTHPAPTPLQTWAHFGPGLFG